MWCTFTSQLTTRRKPNTAQRQGHIPNRDIISDLPAIYISACNWHCQACIWGAAIAKSSRGSPHLQSTKADCVALAAQQSSRGRIPTGTDAAAAHAQGRILQATDARRASPTTGASAAAPVRCSQVPAPSSPTSSITSLGCHTKAPAAPSRSLTRPPVVDSSHCTFAEAHCTRTHAHARSAHERTHERTHLHHIPEGGRRSFT